jgi:homoserine dehydrogenase
MVKGLLKVGIAGLGTVGSGVFKILTEQKQLLAKRIGKEVEITAISVRNKKSRDINIEGIKCYKNAVDMASDNNVDLVVELIGGADGVAYELCIASLKAGKSFVTANKALIARHGKLIAKLAEENNCHVAYEAAVAGGIPIIKALKEGLVANEIKRVSGILNGTCNYMLTAMSKTGRDFDEILKEAQDLGYAEADPAFDVGGVDAAHKLAILTALSFSSEVDFSTVYIEGITNIRLIDIEYAKELGYKIKLLGSCAKVDKGISQMVCPALINEKHPLYTVDGVDNAVFIEGDSVGNVVFRGPGAGQKATASAVVADIADIASGRYSYMFNRKSDELDKASFVDIVNHYCEYYIRITVNDKAGVLASITNVFKKENVSVESVLQKPTIEGQDVHIIVITHKTSEKSIRKSVAKIEKIDNVVSKLNVIRIENLEK